MADRSRPRLICDEILEIIKFLMTTIEHFESVWGIEPVYLDVMSWAHIISYNIFRMDGVSLCLPETKTPALVMNWEEGKMERFDGKE